MKLSSVHHISLNVTDLAAAMAFYQDILGFSEIDRPDLRFPGGWLSMGDQQLHLLQVSEFTAPKGQHFAFGVRDLQAVRSELITQGVEVSEPTTIPGVCEQCFFQDPSGNLLELNQPLAG
ncbi:MAG: VOC family protein [Pseudomonadales bacterium]|nr:VOC family protein [Pseudomonadales bacterium]